MDEDVRQPGESEVEHRYRLEQKAKADRDRQRAEAYRKYREPTEEIARDIAAVVKTLLEDVVGSTTSAVAPANSVGDQAPPSVKIVASMKSQSKAAPHEASVLIIVESAMQGADSAAEMPYVLTGTYGYKAGPKVTSRMPLPLESINPARPVVDVEQLRRALRRLAGLK